MSDPNFNTKPKEGDTFFIHFPAETFTDPEDFAAHRRVADCEDSAKGYVSECGKTMLVLECRVVRRIRP